MDAESTTGQQSAGDHQLAVGDAAVEGAVARADAGQGVERRRPRVRPPRAAGDARRQRRVDRPARRRERRRDRRDQDSHPESLRCHSIVSV